MKSSGSPLADLKETPWWHWLIYAIAFGAVTLFLGLKYDRRLLWGLPILIVCVATWLVVLLHFSFTSAGFRKGYLLLVQAVAVITWLVVLAKVIMFATNFIHHGNIKESSNHTSEVIRQPASGSPKPAK